MTRCAKSKMARLGSGLFKMLIILFCSYSLALSGERASSEAAKQGCDIITINSWDFESGSEGWGGWGYCNESNLFGPDSARSGMYCRGTVCDDYYATFSTYILLSPEMQLPSISSGESVYLSFWHWYAIADVFDWSYAYIEISDDDRVTWDTLREPFDGYDTDWKPDGEWISAYAGKRVFIRFTLYAGLANHIGWYIDDISIVLRTFGVDAGTDTTVCQNQCLPLNAYADCGVWPYNYSWSPGEGLNDPMIQNPEACPESTTTYTVTVTDDSLNTAVDSVVVTVIPGPDPNLRDTTINLGQTLTLNAGGPYGSYQWSTGATSQIIYFTPFSCGDTSIWVTAVLGDCSGSDTAQIHIADTVGPSNVIASDDLCDSVVMSWDDNSDCEDGFWIYRNGLRRDQVGANVTTYTDRPGAGTYSYCIRSHDGADSSGAVCDSGRALASPEPPVNVVASDDSCSFVEIAWSASEEAANYFVYRDGTPMPGGPVADTVHRDSNVVTGTTYVYWVTASNSCGESGQSNSDSGTAFGPPSAPGWCDATEDLCSYVRITWPLVSEATAYHVYRDGEELTPPSGVTDTTFDDMFCDNSAHDYWVRASNQCGMSTDSIGHQGSCIVDDLDPPVTCDASDGTYCDSVLVEWSSAAGATGYIVYRDGSPMPGMPVSDTLWWDTAVSQGSVYSYTVAALNSCDTSGLSGSDNGWPSPSPTIPGSLVASDGTYCGWVRLTWRAAPGASFYRINRDGSELSTTSDTTYDDSNVTPSQVYDYCVTSVTACDESGCSATDSGWSTEGELALESSVVSVDRQAITAVVRSCVSGGLAPYDFEWDFGDHSLPVTHGGIDSCDEVTHQFVAHGDYWATVQVTDAGGCGETDSVPVSVQPPGPPISELWMYPNPAGGASRIVYRLEERSDVLVEIFTLQGRLVRTFSDADASDQGAEMGEHEIVWDLKNESGSVVANGVYICRATATGQETGRDGEIKTKLAVVK